ncbi:MAG TPA: dual specificity protein phosphatase family protein [Terracidiphilus sp.]|jgi:protein-tyrosine phosphatase
MSKDVFWIANTGLAIVARPHGDELLKDDLSRLKNAGIQVLVSTVEEWEAHALGLASEGQLARGLGIEFMSYPMRDRSTPSNRENFTSFAKSLATRLDAGEKIGVHCRGCIGRSTVVTACTLITMGWSAKDALRSIEIAREFPVPDTDEQYAWILAFGAAR